MARIDRDGVGIHYEVAGSGPPIVFTHGFSSSSHMFAGVVADLAADHTVITWDMRGHAGSDSPDDPSAYSAPLAVADLDAVLDTVLDGSGTARAVVAGHSLGGYLSLEYRLARPDRVRALVLIGTGPGYRKDEAREGWNEMARRFGDSYERKGLAALGSSEELNAGVHRDATGLAHAARGILTQRDGRVMASLPTIDVPTLVVVGDRDEMFLGGSRYMADKIPGAELAVIADAGHAPNLSQPAAFSHAVRSFLSRLPEERP